MKTLKWTMYLVFSLGMLIHSPGFANVETEASSLSYIDSMKGDLQRMLENFRGNNDTGAVSRFFGATPTVIETGGYVGVYNELRDTYDDLSQLALNSRLRPGYKEAFDSAERRAAEASGLIYQHAQSLKEMIKLHNAKVDREEDGYDNYYPQSWEAILAEMGEYIHGDGMPKTTIGNGRTARPHRFTTRQVEAALSHRGGLAGTSTPAVAGAGSSSSESELDRLLRGDSTPKSDKPKKTEVSEPCEDCQEPGRGEKIAAYGMAFLGLAAGVVAGVHNYKFANKRIDVAKDLYREASVNGDSPLFALGLLRDAYHPANSPFANIGDMIGPPMYAVQAMFNGRRSMSGSQFDKYMDQKAKRKRLELLYRALRGGGGSSKKTEASRRSKETLEYRKSLESMGRFAKDAADNARKRILALKEVLPAALRETAGIGEMDYGETARMFAESAKAFGAIADTERKVSMMIDNLLAGVDSIDEAFDNTRAKVGGDGSVRVSVERERREDVRTRSQGDSGSRRRFGPGE